MDNLTTKSIDTHDMHYYAEQVYTRDMVAGTGLLSQVRVNEARAYRLSDNLYAIHLLISETWFISNYRILNAYQAGCVVDFLAGQYINVALINTVFTKAPGDPDYDQYKLDCPYTNFAYRSIA